jgi:hypothetical protein
MLKKNYKLIGVMLFIASTCFPPVYAVDWEYDFPYDSDNMYMELEAYYCSSCFLGEEYDGEDIDYSVYEDPTKSYIVNTLLGSSKLFYYSGHGGVLLTQNFIDPPGILNEIWPGNIPDLTSVTGGGNQLFGYISTCHSGDTNGLIEMLEEAFIDEGSDAYFGFIDEVSNGDAYYFSCAYFDSLALANDVEDALDDALDDNNHDINSWEVTLSGDTSTTVVDS